MKLENYNQFVNLIHNKSISFVGLGVSNLSVLKMLANSVPKISKTSKITIRDKSDIKLIRQKVENFSNIVDVNSIKFICGQNYLSDIYEEIIFKSPGIPVNKLILPKDSILTSEIELFHSLCPSPIIAVTGSDGKTTISTLINLLLKEYGIKTHLGGNIGVTLLDKLSEMSPEDQVILELSSFQLETMPNFKSQIAIVSNITPNHLDYHKNFDEYIMCKRNIFVNQSSDDLLILNYDNEITRKFADNSHAKIAFFSTENSEIDKLSEFENCCYLKNNSIFLRKDSCDIKIMNLSDIRIQGIHNVQNYMAAILAVMNRISVTDLRPIQKIMSEFSGVEHRLEFVCEILGVKYYNDSIATSPTRAIAGINALTNTNKKNIVLIAGGYDKNIDLTEFAAVIAEKIKYVVLLGNTKDKIACELVKLGYTEFTLADCLNSVIDIARNKSKSGDIVLLSPGCASFDMFNDFSDRGNLFKKYLLEIN